MPPKRKNTGVKNLKHQKSYDDKITSSSSTATASSSVQVIEYRQAPASKYSFYTDYNESTVNLKKRLEECNKDYVILQDEAGET